MILKFQTQIESDILKTAVVALILCVCILSGCTGRYADSDLPYVDEIEREEYEIYSLAIEQVYLHNLLSHNKSVIKLIVILSETSDLNEYWRDKLIEGTESKGISGEVTEDWRKENESTKPLKGKFDLSYEYHLVSRAELEAYEQDSFFTEFYKKYPDSNGLVSVSKIGFDKAKNNALIHVVHSYGALGASYSFIVLERTGGAWSVVRRISTRGS